MSDVKKPVDLVAIRARMAIKSPCHSASDFTKRLEDQDRLREVDVPDMVDELEAWRLLGADLIAGAGGAHDGDREASRAAAREVIARVRALLPSL